jgi:hypothetical protein
MARVKKNELGEDINNPVQPQDQQAEGSATDAPGTGEPPQAGKSKWVARFGSFGDYQAGVRVIEDRENHLMTIKFNEKPSQAVRDVMKSKEHGFQFDPEEQVWYKKISAARPAQSRKEADDLAFTVANMIRAEKGLEQKPAFSLGG